MPVKGAIHALAKAVDGNYRLGLVLSFSEKAATALMRTEEMRLYAKSDTLELEELRGNEPFHRPSGLPKFLYGVPTEILPSSF